MEHAARLARVGLVFGTRLNGVPSPSRPGSYCRTLTELAERVGVSIVNLSVLKNNRAKVVRFSTLTAICEVLDCEVGDVLGLRPYAGSDPVVWVERPGPHGSVAIRGASVVRTCR